MFWNYLTFVFHVYLDDIISRLASTLILSEKVDIYSFGVVLFEALCGKPPLIRDRGSANNKIHIVDWVLILSNDMWNLKSILVSLKTHNSYYHRLDLTMKKVQSRRLLTTSLEETTMSHLYGKWQRLPWHVLNLRVENDQPWMTFAMSLRRHWG